MGRSVLGQDQAGPSAGVVGPPSAAAPGAGGGGRGSRGPWIRRPGQVDLHGRADGRGRGRRGRGETTSADRTGVIEHESGFLTPTGVIRVVEPFRLRSN